MVKGNRSTVPALNPPPNWEGSALAHLFRFATTWPHQGRNPLPSLSGDVAGPRRDQESFPAMSAARGRRRWPLLCLAILYGVWVLCFHCRAVAIPIFPSKSRAKPRHETTLVGRRPAPSDRGSPPGAGDPFHDSKRHIPSCPDPLHNR